MGCRLIGFVFLAFVIAGDVNTVTVAAAEGGAQNPSKQWGASTATARIVASQSDRPASRLIVNPSRSLGVRATPGARRHGLDPRAGKQLPMLPEMGDSIFSDPAYVNTPSIDDAMLVVPGANRQIADHIATVALAGCMLEGYEFSVSGGGDGTGIGFSAEFALYDDCPGAGGQIIDGTQAALVFDDDGPHHVILDFSASPVAMPSDYWAAIVFDSDSAGWYAGRPASLGFTANRYHDEYFPCGAPPPQMQFYAGFHFASYCAAPFVREFLAYSDARFDVQSLFLVGDNRWVVDDFRLIDGLESDTCLLSSFDVAAVGTGSHASPQPFTLTVELWSECDPSTVIPGTQQVYQGHGDGTREVMRFNIPDAPALSGGQPYYFAWKTSPPASAIVSGAATLGMTEDVFSFYGPPFGDCPEVCDCYVSFDAQPFAGFFLNVRCVGEEPLGACCDLGALSPSGDDSEFELCSNVPEAQCNGPLQRFALGQKCPGTCSNSFERCTTNAECDGGICLLASPFDPPCGTAACCTPPFPSSQDEGCENLTEPECSAIYDDMGCFDALGEPILVCNGDGARCTNDSDCPGSQTCQPMECLGDADCGEGTCEVLAGARRAVWQQSAVCDEQDQDCPLDLSFRNGQLRRDSQHAGVRQSRVL